MGRIKCQLPFQLDLRVAVSEAEMCPFILGRATQCDETNHGRIELTKLIPAVSHPSSGQFLCQNVLCSVNSRATLS
jgi:hypothetical protein